MIVYQELSTLCRDLGIPARTLYAVSNSIGKHYREVRLPKKDGSFRTLSVPDEVLKRIQRAIADVLLIHEPVSSYATAYRVAVGIERNALPHVGKPKVLKMDVARFFDSIRYSDVKEKVFPASRYSEQNRILLAMLCYYKDVLPQGAPSSPAITNVLLRDFDERVGAWCGERRIAYTRYCDDMTFSGDFDEKEVVAFVTDELKALGFTPNKRKTTVVTAGKRQTVTGLVVNEKVSLPVDYKRQIRMDVHYCERFGVESHLKAIGSPLSPEAYLTSLLGRIQYGLHICPDNAAIRSYRETVKKLLRDTKRTK